MAWQPRTHTEQQLADQLSKLEDGSQWALNQRVVERILAQQALGGRRPTIDAFADPWSKKADMFYSREWCAGTAGVDGFAQSWAPPREGPKPLMWIKRRSTRQAGWCRRC